MRRKSDGGGALSTLLRAQAAALRAQADTLDAAASEAETSSDRDGKELLGLDEIARRYKVSRDSAVAAIRRSELAAVVGPRRKILIADAEIERWLGSRPYRPSEKKSDEADSLASWEASASASLRELVQGEA